jgi:dUTP pyrophosphatase
MIIEFAKQRESIKTPSRTNPSDAGLDIYADLQEDVEISPGGNQMIPTGLRFGIPHGYMLQVCNRGSMGAKRSLIVGAHIIDAGYDGEVFIDLHNIGDTKQIIKGEDKIAQVILVPVVHFRTMEAQAGELYGTGEKTIAISTRGEDSLGSSDEKGCGKPCATACKNKVSGSCKKEIEVYGNEPGLDHPLHNMPPGF